MKLTIANIAGGQPTTIRSLPRLAEVVVRHTSYGGWDILDFVGDDKVDVDDVHAVIHYAAAAADEWRYGRSRRMPATAKEWRWVAEKAIAIAAS